MIFCQLGRAQSLREIEQGLASAEGRRLEVVHRLRCVVRQHLDRNAQQNGGENRCENCDRKVEPGEKSEKGVTPPGKERQADHIIPKSKGGDGSPSNGQTLCRDCNLDKKDKMLPQ
jgi:5-methylcytosine-specific restriction endonuclease McrA